MHWVRLLYTCNMAKKETTKKVNSKSKQKSILIIEDETFLRELYEELLRDAGYEVTAVEDGLCGLIKAFNFSYDLVWSGVMLPYLDGLSILEWLNKYSVLQGFYIFVTNLGQDAVIKRGFELGADQYYIKSAYTPAQLLHFVNEIFESGKSARNDSFTHPVSPSFDTFAQIRKEIASKYGFMKYGQFENQLINADKNHPKGSYTLPTSFILPSDGPILQEVHFPQTSEPKKFDRATDGTFIPTARNELSMNSAESSCQGDEYSIAYSIGKNIYEAYKSDKFTFGIPDDKIGSEESIYKNTLYLDQKRELDLQYQIELDLKEYHERYNPKGAQILIAGNEEEVYMTAKQLYHQETFINIATSGLTFQNKIYSNFYDLILVLKPLPIVDAIDALRSIQSIDRPQGKIIIASKEKNTDMTWNKAYEITFMPSITKEKLRNIFKGLIKTAEENRLY